jgi:hypothetical protein
MPHGAWFNFKSHPDPKVLELLIWPAPMLRWQNTYPLLIQAMPRRFLAERMHSYIFFKHTLLKVLLNWYHEQIQSLTSITYNGHGIQTTQWPPRAMAGQELSRIKCLAQHGAWWAEGEPWYLPKEGLGHQAWPFTLPNCRVRQGLAVW